MKSFLFFPTLIVLISAECFGQNDFRPGYIVTNNLDTIHGAINLKSNVRNSKSCEFKGDKSDERKLFLPGDIYGYRIENYKFYVSRQIEINGAKRSVFLEYLIKGIVDLFYYIDSGDEYYFIYRDGVLYPLTNNQIQVTLNDKVFEQRSNSYVGMLKTLFKDSPETLKDVEKVSFGYEPLIRISKEYHNNVCKSQDCIDFTHSTKIKIVLEPYIGYYNSWDRDVRESTLRASGRYYAVNVRFLPFRIHSVWSFYTGIAYYQQYFHHDFPPELLTQNAVTRFESFVNTIQIPFGAEYTFPGKRFQPYLALSYNSQFYPKSYWQITDFLSDVRIDVYQYGYKIYDFCLSADLGLKYNLNKNHYLFLRNKMEYNPTTIFTEVLSFGAGFNIN
jgi:hypothetical protein